MLFTRAGRKRIMQAARRLFGTVPCKTQVAALPWRQSDSGVEVMLITSRGTGRWVLPKGWPERGEELFEAARREAGEEAGIDGRIESQAVGRYIYDKVKSSGDEVTCEVIVYPMHVASEAETWPERSRRTRRWVRASEAAGMVHEPDLAALLQRFSPMVHRAA